MQSAPLIRLDKASLAFGARPLLDHADLIISENAKICLVGRNGEGKSTLLKVLMGQVQLDDGLCQRRKPLKLSYLSQDIPQFETETAGQIVASGLDAHRVEVESVFAAQAVQDESAIQAALAQLVESEHWQSKARVDTLLSQFNLKPEQRVKDLSGGWRRRVLLAKALACDPDLLLLDEPTNHLDINAIAWLESTLLQFNGALLFVSHDRAFVRRMATEIIELDRGVIRHFHSGYDAYLLEKEKLLEEEERHNKLFDKKLAEEEAWIRQGIKARRTRNEGRVRALKKLREEHKARLSAMGQTNISLNSGQMSGKLVAEMNDVSFAYDAASPLIRDFSATVMRGDKIGILGTNGMGKTTLLNVLLGQQEPTAGTVRQGTKLSISYFDQLRSQLDPEVSVKDAVADGHTYVELGEQSRHVISYLNDFLFSSARVNSPIKSLSGGEQNRLLIAKLFAKPSNLIVMDEPTNDLDVDTLELLEEQLLNYPGTLLITSHDRDFLDSVVTSTWVFEGDGRISEYVGGYSDWLSQTDGVLFDRSSQQSETKPVKEQAQADNVQQSAPKAKPKKKLSYKLQRELESLPGDIEAVESLITELETQISQPDFYEQDHEKVQFALSQLTDHQTEHERLLERWMELEEEAGL